MISSMRGAANTRSRQAGFTLLEMIVALAALSLLMVMLTGTVQFGARAWEGQSRRVEAYAETDAVHSVLRTMLQGARPIPLVGFEQPTQATNQSGDPSSGDPPQQAQSQATPQANQQAPQGEQRTGVYLIGRTNAVDFVGELPEMAGQGGLYDIHLWLNPEGRLLLSWRRHVRLATGGSPPGYQDTELLRNVAALELAYYAVGTDKKPSEWSSTWDRNSGLPALITIRVRFKSGDARIWRELTAAPILGAVHG
jgi:prepilin-type N-terminal cleavage/methylation domain-containing protein